MVVLTDTELFWKSARYIYCDPYRLVNHQMPPCVPVLTVGTGFVIMGSLLDLQICVRCWCLRHYLPYPLTYLVVMYDESKGFEFAVKSLRWYCFYMLYSDWWSWKEPFQINFFFFFQILLWSWKGPFCTWASIVFILSLSSALCFYVYIYEEENEILALNPGGQFCSTQILMTWNQLH